MATTSQPRSLLSIARLNMARSRARPSILSFVRIDQTCLGRRGGFVPVTLPLFQGTRVVVARSCMVILLDYRGREACATGYGIEIRSAFGRMRTWNADRLRATGRE